VILAGVDEAGYGPILGPLCVAMASFHVEGAADPGAAARAVRRAFREGGVRAEDSKRVHRPAAGIGPLEREVLAVLAARDGEVPRTGAALLAALGAAAPPGDHPWYAGLAASPVPAAADAAEALERGRALARALEARGVAIRRLEVEVLPEGRFNESVARLGSKAAVNFECAARFLRAAAGDADEGGPVDLLLDRQGGRARYGALLRALWPRRPVRVLREGRGVSSYEAGPLRVRFEVGADASSPAAGLASMAAKLLREVHVAALNRRLLREAPGVRPTAGYWTDGRRFLRETAEARRRLGVDEALLVRSR
jgi:hypothetical protein